MGNGENSNSITWSKVGPIALPVILTALVTVIGFLVMQIMSLKDEIADLRVSEAEHFGQLSAELGRHKFRLEALSAKIGSVTEIRIRGGVSP